MKIKLDHLLDIEELNNATGQMKTNLELFKNGDELRQRWQGSFSGKQYSLGNFFLPLDMPGSGSRLWVNNGRTEENP